MTTYGKILGMNEYMAMSRAWIPQERGSQAMFCIRIPQDWEKMDYRDFEEMMKLKLEWLMQEAVESGIAKEEVQQELVQTLHQLNPIQEAPSLMDEDGDEMQLWSWTMKWAESLVEFNSTWYEWFQVMNPDIYFPVELNEYPSSTTTMELHDEMTLDQFLMELRTQIQ